jgi:hypothetical protein
MFAPAQHIETYMRACKIESYEEDGKVYNQGKLLVIGILDSTCVNQTSHTITLRKESEMYKDMTMEFNKEVASMSKDVGIIVH